MIEIDALGCEPLGMPPGRFLSEFWQQRPLLIRNAFPGFASPLQPEDLAGLACEELALSRIISHERGSDRYALRTGPFAEEDFPGMPHSDWTLLVQDVDKWDADVAALLPHFAFLPRWRIDDVMVSFAAPGGSVGAHVDQYDVFLLQAQGRRRWQIDASANPPLEFRDDAEIKLLRRFTPTHDWVLEPGDMLYLPPGVPHHGVAEDACLTFSLGMRAPSAAELLVDFAESVAAGTDDAVRYADPGLEPARDPALIDDAALGRVREALQRLPLDDDAAIARWFGGFITAYRSAGAPSPGEEMTAGECERLFSAGGALMRHPFTRMAWAARPGGAWLFASGEAHATKPDTATRIANAEIVDAALWAALDADGRALLAALASSGHFQPADS